MADEAPSISKASDGDQFCTVIDVACPLRTYLSHLTGSNSEWVKRANG